MDADMLPPDESLEEYDLWNGGNQNSNHPQMSIEKHKGSGRHDSQLETGNFNQKRKQWEQRKSDLTEGEKGQNNLN
jgi:hypothetical protein